LMLNGEAGYGEGYGDKPLPFFKNFYAGGVSSVRGYRSFTIGPKDSNGDPTGGNRKLVGNAEVLFPFPGLANDRSVRLSAFIDSGMVGDSADNFSFDYLRASAGLSLQWVSPIGPLKISLAQPFRNQPGDQLQRFQFTVGGLF